METLRPHSLRGLCVRMDVTVHPVTHCDCSGKFSAIVDMRV